MGSFACYCALCCGPLGIYDIKLGSSKARALARRKKRVENKARRLKGEDVVHEDSREWKDMEIEEDKAAKEEEDAEMKDADANEAVETEQEQGGEDGADTHDGPWDSDEEEIDPVELGDGETDDDDDQEEGDLGDNDDEESGGDSGDECSDEEDDADFSDKFSQTSELSLHSTFDMAANCKDETDSMNSYYEKHAYDPTKLSLKDVRWVDRARVLAINREWEGKKKVYLSGRGRYNDLVRSFHPLVT